MLSSYQQIVAITIGVQIVLAFGTYLPLAAGRLAAGQGAFMAIGAFTSSVATMLWGIPLIPALLLGAVVAGFAGAVVGIPTLRLQGIYFAIGTLAFMMVTQVLLQTINYGRMREDRFLGINGPLGFETVTYVKENGISTGEYLLLVVGVVVLCALLLFFLERSRFGAALRASEQNRLAAEAIGIDVARVRVLTFTLGAFIVGIAGGLHAHFITTISASDFGFWLSTLAVIYIVVGGRDVFWGALLGAFTLALLPELLRFMADFRMQAYGALMIIMILIRPRGVLDRELVESIGRFLRLRRPRAVAVPLPGGGGDQGA